MRSAGWREIGFVRMKTPEWGSPTFGWMAHEDSGFPSKAPEMPKPC